MNPEAGTANHLVADRVTAEREMIAIREAIESLPDRIAPRLLPVMLERCHSIVDAVEARLDAEALDKGHDERSLQNQKRRNGNSKARSKKKVRRSKAIANNPDLGDKLASGETSTENVDALANGDAASDGAASSDQDLVDTVLGQTPDQARKTVNAWLRDRESNDDARDRHTRERRSRSVRRTRQDGLPTLLVQGDEVSIEQIWASLSATADAAYRAAGGRDVPTAEHVPIPNRRFDSLFAAVTQTGAGDGGPSGRPTVIFGATVDPDADMTAELLGGGKIPSSLLEQIVCNADLHAALLSTDGEPLWLGRARRHASRAQWMALVARDKGCVLCGAPHTHCEAHHLTPWHAPASGRTDIDQLALVCSTCHHHIHDTGQTLYRDGRDWRLRPATEAETPPSRKVRPTKAARANAPPRATGNPDDRSPPQDPARGDPSLFPDAA